MEGKRKWVNNVTIENIKKFHFKDFTGRKYQGQRSVGVELDPDFAMNLISEGWKVKHLDAIDDYDEKYYIPVKINYGYDRNGVYRHPDIYKICGDVCTLLDEETVSDLDKSEIENVDLTFGPYFNQNGEITAYLQTMYVTIRQDHLNLKYQHFFNQTLVEDAEVEELPF